jgi:cytidine deaminase
MDIEGHLQRRQVSKEVWGKMSDIAWNYRNQAFILGNTKVGAAALSDSGMIFGGCNIEHRFRCHDIHAEVNAISSLVGGGGKRLAAILIVAERELFTPCGGCMDWIFQFGGPECYVAFQSKRTATISKYLARKLMPFYPR